MNSSETSMSIYKSKRRHIQNYLNLSQYRPVTVVIRLAPQKWMWVCEISPPVIPTKFALFCTNVGQPRKESTINPGQKHNISALKPVDPITLEHPDIGPSSSRTPECSCWKLNRPYFSPFLHTMIFWKNTSLQKKNASCRKFSQSNFQLFLFCLPFLMLQCPSG